MQGAHHVMLPEHPTERFCDRLRAPKLLGIRREKHVIGTLLTDIRLDG